MGVLDSIWLKHGPTSDRIWFFCIQLDIIENIYIGNQLRDELKNDKDGKIKLKLRMQKISFFKLLSDAVFCGVDVFAVKTGPDVLQSVSGLISGILGVYKLVKKIE